MTATDMTDDVPTTGGPLVFLAWLADEVEYLAAGHPIPKAFTVAREAWWATADTSKAPIGDRLYLRELPA